jgi:hypothetical protein
MLPEVSIFLAMIAFVVCFFGLILVGLVVAGVFIFGRVGKTQKEAGQALAEDTRAFFERSAAELYPMSAAALADISSQLEVNGRAALGNVHYRGKMQSLSQTGRAYVCFDLQLKFGKGAMQLRTDRRRLQLTFGGIGVSQVQAFVDEQPFGSLVDEKEVSLRDPLDRVLGSYHRHPLSAVGIAIEPARFNFKSYYGAIDMGERTLAELNRNPLLGRLPSGTEAASLFQHIAPDLREDEELWLLLLAGWEIYIKILAR